MTEIIDLTCPFDVEYSVPQYLHHNWRLEFKPLFTYPRDGQRVMEFRMSTHSGTHVDAPSHVLAEGKHLDAYHLSTFHGSGVVLDVPCGEHDAVGREQLEAADIGVRQGDIVLLCTGWGKYLTEEPKDTYYLALNHPGLSVDGARWLLEKRVKLVGIDTFSIRGVDANAEIDSSVIRPGVYSERIPTKDRLEPVHETLLSNDILICEQLTNLHLVAGRRCTLSILPLNFRAMDGAPARAIAIL